MSDKYYVVIVLRNNVEIKKLAFADEAIASTYAEGFMEACYLLDDHSYSCVVEKENYGSGDIRE